MYIKRLMEQDINDSAKHFPVIGILGPRQSGKTTLAKHTFSKYRYANFEDDEVRELAETDPKGFLAEYENQYGIIIDEFQRVPSFLSTIQVVADERRKAGYFVLTGSHNYLMNKAITQSLAGRIAIHTLLPLSIKELENADLLPVKLEILVTNGMYPSLYVPYEKQEDGTVRADKWYRSYIHTYLERDVRQLKDIENISLFKTFMGLCAGRTGQVINYTSLSNDCGVSVPTIQQWIRVLEASYIVFLLKPYHTNFNKRLIKSPKIYFYDTGLLSHLVKMVPETYSSHYLKGGIFENLIISDFYKQYYNRGVDPAAYFWRDQTRNEIDCILDVNTHRVPVEIKSSQTITNTFFKGFAFFNKLTDSDPANNYIIYAGDAGQKRSLGTVLNWQASGTFLDRVIK